MIKLLAIILTTLLAQVTLDPVIVLQKADDEMITAERVANQWTIKMLQAQRTYEAAYKSATESCVGDERKPKGKLTRESGVWYCVKEKEVEVEK